jgi:hypothetical protein
MRNETLYKKSGMEYQTKKESKEISQLAAERSAKETIIAYLYKSMRRIRNALNH